MKLLKKSLDRLSKRKTTLRAQFFAITAFFVLSGTFAILLANSQLIPLIYSMRQKNTLVSIAHDIENSIYYSKDFYGDLAVIEQNNNVEIQIYNDSSLVYHSAINRFMQDWVEGSGIDLFDVMRTRNLTVEQHEDNKDGSYFEKLIDEGSGLQYSLYGRELGSSGELKIIAQQDYLNNRANSTTRYVSIVACTTFMLIIISMYIYLHHFSKPILEMNKITRSMAEMDFSQKCPPYSNNEIGELGRSINTLSQSLDSTIKDLQQKNERLKEDIERERKLELIKKEFVSNSSHELKTPIAIIQGYAEGLKLGINRKSSDAEEYCDIIIEETHKMNRLVCEMLELSKYESATYKLNKVSFDISGFVAQSIDSYDILAKEAGIEITNSIPGGIVGYGDTERLEMVVNNYVSNAISHAKYDKKIVISAKSTAESTVISVFNTGDHIAPEDIENIWLSFYRANKAHSREEGRFGLGLSIVKAIQELHGAQYGVKNVDGGVEFTFEIKNPPNNDSEENKNEI